MAATSQKKGDLEVTLLEARNLGVRKSSNLYCTLNMSRENKTYQSSISKGSQWNQTFTLDLLSLDSEELNIELFKQRRIKKDKFLGQIQIPIKALKLPKEATWYFLCDRPEAGLDDPPPWILLINPEHKFNLTKSPSGSGSSLNLNKSKKSYIISGEVLIKLQFVHRLIRARSQNALRKTPGGGIYSTVGPSVDVAGFDKNNKRLSRAASSIPYGSPSFFEGSENGASSLAVIDESNEGHGPLAKPNEKEAIIIDEALKERQKIAREKLDKQKILLRDMTERILTREKNEGEPAVHDEKLKLEEIQQNVLAMEDALKSSVVPEREKRPLDKRERSILLHEGKKSSPRITPRTKVSLSDLPRLELTEADSLAHNLTHLEELHHTTSASSSPLIRTAQAHAQAHAQAQAQAQALAQAQAEEISALQRKVAILEVELESEKKVSDVLRTNNNLLEKEVKRLEAEIDRERWERERSEREEKWRDRLLEIEKLFLRQQLAMSQQALDDEEKEDLSNEVDEDVKVDDGGDERTKKLNERVELAQSLLKDVDADIQSTKLLKQQLHTEVVESRLKKQQRVLKKLQNHRKSLEVKLSEQLVDEDEEEEDEEAEATAESESAPEEEGEEPLSPTSKSAHRRRKSEAQMDMLVDKLQKLDKLDELLRKIDSIKVAPANGGGSDEAVPIPVAEAGKGANDMKSELEQLQLIIFDDTNKYTDKEKFDANIKYERVFQIYQTTEEYKKDVAEMLDERRKRNEPLNKEALARVIDKYSADNIKGNAELKQNLVKAPELNLIFMDPKAILAKHQNDFQQYQLNKLDLDELRAIRACLPKFRKDQVKQSDWVDSLEQKIELYAKNPPVKKDIVQKAATKFKKPKTSKPSSPGDFLVELLQRFKGKPEEKEKEEEEEKEKKGSRRHTVSFRSPLGRLRSFSKSDPADS